MPNQEYLVSCLTSYTTWLKDLQLEQLHETKTRAPTGSPPNIGGRAEERGARGMDRLGSRQTGGEPRFPDEQHALSGVALGHRAPVPGPRGAPPRGAQSWESPAKFS